jgi:hypothetical protein
VTVRVSPSCTLAQIRMDSGQRDLKNFLSSYSISSQTTLDPLWKQVTDNTDHRHIISDYLGMDYWWNPGKECLR